MRNFKKANFVLVFFFFMFVICMCLCGCSDFGGYSNESLFPDEVRTVYVEMFDSRSFRRGVEYELTDALAKRIEASTPYRIESNRDEADTVMSGQIVGVGGGTLSSEFETGRALERDVTLQAVVDWKDLKTGDLLIDNISVSASASYSEWQNQGFDYGSSLAANKLARRIVELMEKEW